MVRSYMTLIFSLFFIYQVFSQESEIKKNYIIITDAINSELITQKGAYEISGSIFYNYLKTEYDYNEKDIEKIFQAESGIAHFFLNDLSFGFLFSFLHQKINNRIYEQSMIGPVIRKYFGEDMFRPYLFTDYLFLVGDNFDGGELDIGAGVLCHISGNFGIKAEAKYGIIFPNKNYISEQHRIFIGLGIVNFIL